MNDKTNVYTINSNSNDFVVYLGKKKDCYCGNDWYFAVKNGIPSCSTIEQPSKDDFKEVRKLCNKSNKLQIDCNKTR